MTGNLGNRCVCSECSAKFYDLGKKKPSCPKCGVAVGGAEKPVEVVAEAPIEEKEVQEQEIDDVGDIDLSDFNDEQHAC